MADITAASAVLILNVPPILQPTQLQGFATDDVYDVPRIKSVETQMGVDGLLSGGFVYVEVMQTIRLQADSLSNRFFDAWWSQMQADKTTYPANGIITLPSISTKFQQTRGFLTGYKPAPQAKKILQAREFEITWQSIQPAAIA